MTVTSGSLLTGDTLAATASGSATNVADSTPGNNPVAAGYKVVHGEVDVTENYQITTAAGTLTINPAAVTITAASEAFTYDGSAHSNDGYDVSGLVGSDAISAVVTGSITFPSESPVTNEVKSYEFTTGTPGNYSVTTANGQLTMTKASAAITITAASGSKTYDGSALTDSTVTVTSGSLLTGDTLVAEATGSATNVADSTPGNNPVADGYKIMHGEVDVTENYVIETEAGTLTITPAPLTITANDQTYPYNGEIQGPGDTAYDDPADIEAYFTIKGLKGNDTVTRITLDGQGQDPGEYDLVPSEAAIGKDGAANGNYEIEYVNGKLTIEDVEPMEILVTIVGHNNGNGVQYDKGLKTVTGYTVVSITLDDGKPLPAGTDISEKDLYRILSRDDEGKPKTTAAVDVDKNTPSVSRIDAGTFWMGLNANNFGCDKEGFKVTFKVTDGWVKVNPKPVTVKADNVTIAADEAVPELTATVTGLIAPDTAAVINFTITREEGKEPGKSYVITPTGAPNQGNYVVTYETGTLTIEEAVAGNAPETNQDPPGTDPVGPGTIGGNEEIEDPEVPLARMQSTWSLIDLILTIGTTILAALTGISLVKDPNKGEEGDNKRKWSKLLGIIPAAGTIITFILTQDLSGKMILVDKWTILMAILGGAGGAITYFTRNKKPEEMKEEKV